jgi:hypothetical protein
MDFITHKYLQVVACLTGILAICSCHEQVSGIGLPHNGLMPSIHWSMGNHTASEGPTVTGTISIGPLATGTVSFAPFATGTASFIPLATKVEQEPSHITAAPETENTTLYEGTTYTTTSTKFITVTYTLGDGRAVTKTIIKPEPWITTSFVVYTVQKPTSTSTSTSTATDTLTTTFYISNPDTKTPAPAPALRGFVPEAAYASVACTVTATAMIKTCTVTVTATPRVNTVAITATKVRHL